jgi:hypothetical protein
MMYLFVVDEIYEQLYGSALVDVLVFLYKVVRIGQTKIIRRTLMILVPFVYSWEYVLLP